MAIFARLVMMFLGIFGCAGFAAAFAAANFAPRDGIIIAGAIGAAGGIFVGKFLGNTVVGKPPKD
jgi:NADPH-dependent curcumin reductase CurA